LQAQTPTQVRNMQVKNGTVHRCTGTETVQAVQPIGEVEV
jgi:hypothetical protein